MSANKAIAAKVVREHRTLNRSVLRRTGRGPAFFPVSAAISSFPKVSLRDISLTYGFPKGRLVALEHINLQVAPGEFLCIVGPSGCGKSTLLHLIAGLEARHRAKCLSTGRGSRERVPTALLIFQELVAIWAPKASHSFAT
ncbi:MAG: ATP-binding cassette domain-containing protein [Acidobacteria bacterium]|nr:ATP-binding cassette domain-containing protein [Acidobacteriota bacterium]